MKRCEQHLQRAATDDTSPKAKVLATEISGQDTAAELAALKTTTRAQDAKIKALSAQLRGDTSGAKRARNGVPVEKKPIPVCTVCSKRGHNAVDCWDKLDTDQAKLDLAKAARDKKKADMSKLQLSSKETKDYTATVASNKALAAAAAASDSDYSTCHASLHGCVFDQEFLPHTPGTVLDSGAQVNILEGTLGSGIRIQLTGITGATTEAERADAVFPSGTTPKTYRSWSRKRIALRALGTLNVTLSLPRNCANRRRSNCLWYEESLPLQTIKITCRISSAKSSTAL